MGTTEGRRFCKAYVPTLYPSPPNRHQLADQLSSCLQQIVRYALPASRLSECRPAPGRCRRGGQGAPSPLGRRINLRSPGRGGLQPSSALRAARRRGVAGGAAGGDGGVRGAGRRPVAGRARRFELRPGSRMGGGVYQCCYPPKKVTTKNMITRQTCAIFLSSELSDVLLSTRTSRPFSVKCQRAPSRAVVKSGPKAQRLTDNA